MRAPADRDRLDSFLQALGHTLQRPVRLYLVGGAVWVQLGLREATLDIDYVVRADDPEAIAEFERAIPVLKERLNVNVEPASPAGFPLIPPGVLDRSPYVGNYGVVAVYYFHLPSLVLAKAARGAERDLADIELVVHRGIVEWGEVEETWRRVRAVPTGWLRHTPAEVERRLAVVRLRLQGTGG